MTTVIELPYDSPPIRIFIPGTPAPQGSMKAFVIPGTRRANVVADNPKTRPWREHVALTVRAQIGPSVMFPRPAAVVLGFEFVMPRRKAEPKRVTPRHTRKPDLDKLIRATKDALTGRVYDDDAQVDEYVRPRKRTAEIGETPGLHLTIWETT